MIIGEHLRRGLAGRGGVYADAETDRDLRADLQSFASVSRQRECEFHEREAGRSVVRFELRV